MRLSLTEIPNAFGGFAPFPNTIMIPTMGLQSAVIGYRFGFGYEQGKRRLRSMSNEEFNTLDEAAEQAIFKRHDSAAINYFKVEMHNWVELQNLIIEKSVEIEVMKANRTPSAFREMFEGFTKGFSNQQKEDAGKFFAGLNDTLLKIMAFFTGHRGSSVPISLAPVGTTTEGTGRRQTTRQVFAGERFERTLEEAQVDTSRSRGTGIIGASATPAQVIERKVLLKKLASRISIVKKLENIPNLSGTLRRTLAFNKQQVLVLQQALKLLERRFTF